MKCTVDGVEYERVENKNSFGCDGCVANGNSTVKLELCGQLGECFVPDCDMETDADEDYIWVKVEHE